jgi:uncharacterized membrane protein YfcA
MDDWQQHRKRRVANAAVLLLVIGLTLGAVLGIALARVFDAAPLDEIQQEFSGPDADGGSAPDNLRP